MPKDIDWVLMTERGALCLMVVISLISIKGNITPNSKAKKVRLLPIIRRAKLLLKYIMMYPNI